MLLLGENKYKFQKLTPVKDVDMTLYGDALDFVFDNPDVRNVAISGAYGAGKSSMLESYKERHKKSKFIHISLAHFEQFNKEGIVEVKEVTLEGKILNQLIHQIPAEQTPQSNFRVKKKVGGVSQNTALVLVFLLSFLHIIFFESWSKYVDSLSASWFKDFLNISCNPYSQIASGLLCAIIFGIFVWAIIRAQKNKNVFRKISVQGNEIEIFEDNEDSYFDKYLNEVLYLFENAAADVVVFEDMDRFNSNRIFERLREINTLANISLTKNGKGLLRFFYLLRDDIFVSKDRTKFFDYIIPIVPVVDSSNSYDQFIAHFKQGGFFELLDENFLQGLSLYVDDMRILKNIYNEFVVYYTRLNTTELDCNKMLAMVTYKNIFPRDFSELQLNRGFVYALFSNKKYFLEIEIDQLNLDVSKKLQEFENVNNEDLLSQKELDIVYDAKRHRNHYGQLSALNEQDQKEYDNRKHAIEIKEQNRIDELEAQISTSKYKIIQAESKQMKDILTRENVDKIFRISETNEIGMENDFNEIKSSNYFPLLKYLIWNGYIDETYADYMTYFYENSLSRVDKVFLRSITDRKAKEFTYQLKKPSIVIARLRLVDFDQVEILNFDLLEHLLQTPAHKPFTERFMQQLQETKNFQFIGAYFDTKREQMQYVRTLNSSWPGLFSYALQNKTLTSKQLYLYSISSIYHSSSENLKEMNARGCLTKYVSENPDYLGISEPNIKKLISCFKILAISFARINSSNANENLFMSVYENSLYEINFENISLMLNSFYPQIKESAVIHQSQIPPAEPGA